MKKFTALFLLLLLLFLFASCGAENESTSPDNTEITQSTPILGVEVKNEKEASFYALTKSELYTWNEIKYDGEFCLDRENLCTFTRKLTDGKIKLRFSGNLVSYEVYSAPCEEIESDKQKIIDDKYKTNEKGAITFPESGKYYYFINVKYTQGELGYGFLVEK